MAYACPVSGVVRLRLKMLCRSWQIEQQHGGHSVGTIRRPATRCFCQCYLFGRPACRARSGPSLAVSGCTPTGTTGCHTLPSGHLPCSAAAGELLPATVQPQELQSGLQNEDPRPFWQPVPLMAPARLAMLAAQTMHALMPTVVFADMQACCVRCLQGRWPIAVSTASGACVLAVELALA